MKKHIALVFALVLGTTSMAFADDASDTKAQIQALQAQLDAVKAQLDKLQAQQAKPVAAPRPGPAPAGDQFLRRKPGDNVTFLLGNADEVTLYGQLDLSIDHTTKGLRNFYPSSGDTPVGNTSYLTGISSNLSYGGVRGSHKLGPQSALVYQLETQFDISSTPGTVNTNSNNDSIVKGALFSRNSYIGIMNRLGAFKIGKTDAPYKNSTARMNPFNGMIGDYAVIMGNTGGDNRVEFGTRLDHAVWYESPNMGGWTFNLLAAPGQNRSSDNGNIAAGESSCAGGNVPGSGALAPTCNDGSYATAYSANLAYQNRSGFYMTGAYEIHKHVNRTSDLPDLNPADVGDEHAVKGGMQYTFNRRTTVSGIYEVMTRDVPPFLQFQNERSRDGYWFALSHLLDPKNSLNFGWAHANASPGDPGQHNTSGGLNPDNAANLYTFMYRHNVDRHVSWYADWALTLNHPDAHYDLGAGGRGLTTDCHDASNLTAFDPTNPTLVSGTGPHCYAGGRLQGFSAGVNVRF